MIRLILILLITISGPTVAQLKTGSGGTTSHKSKRRSDQKSNAKKVKEDKKEIKSLFKDIKKISKKTWFECYKELDLKSSDVKEFSNSLAKIIILENQKVFENISKNNIFTKECSKTLQKEKKIACQRSKRLSKSISKFLVLGVDYLVDFLYEEYELTPAESLDLIEILEAFELLNMSPKP